MDLAEALIARCTGGATAAITTRVGWVKRDQGASLPAVVFSRISRFEEQTLSDPLDLIETGVRASCFATSHAVAWALADAVIADLRDPADVGEILFWEAEVDGPIDLGEDAPQGFLHQASVDLTLRHSEPA